MNIFSIYSGGTTLTFSGSYFNVTQSSVIQIIDPRFNTTQEVSSKQLYILNASSIFLYVVLL